MIGGSINTKIIEQQLGEVMRLAASIQQGHRHGIPDPAQTWLLPSPRTVLLSHCVRSEGSSEASSCWRGLKIQRCVGA